MKKKQNEGITLVALVITIIVLIILAGVSINAVMNEGLITNAKDAKNEYEVGKKQEETKIVDLEVKTDFAKEGILYKFESQFLTGIAMNQKVSEVRAELEKVGYDIYDINGNSIEDDSINVTTGMVIKNNGDIVGTVVVYGDINCKGFYDNDDVIEIEAIFALGDPVSYWNENYEDYQKIAMDVDHDNIISYKDIELMLDGLIVGGTQINQKTEASDLNVLTLETPDIIEENYRKSLGTSEKFTNSQFIVEWNDAEDYKCYVLKGVQTNVTSVKKLLDVLPDNTKIKRGTETLNESQIIENDDKVIYNYHGYEVVIAWVQI